MTSYPCPQPPRTGGWPTRFAGGAVLGAVVSGILGVQWSPVLESVRGFSSPAVQQLGEAPVQAAGEAASTDADAGSSTAGTNLTFTDASPDQAKVRIAIAFAMAQIGLPYVWGGDGPAQDVAPTDSATGA